MRGRRLIACALFLGCGTPKQPAPPPVPTEAQVCAKLMEWQHATSGHGACVKKLAQLRADEPVFYECLARCFVGADSEDKGDTCAKACPHEPLDAELDAEAMNFLASVHKASANAFQAEVDESGTGAGPFVQRFCPSSTAPVPAELPPAKHLAEVAPAAWETPTWKCLHLSLGPKVAFQYEYEWNGKTGPEARYRATARRKLEDGRTRTFVLAGMVTPVGQVVRNDLLQLDE